MHIRESLSATLRALSKAKGVSQKMIAFEARVSESKVSRWFDPDNLSLPDVEELAAICRLLDIDPAMLLAPLRIKADTDPGLIRLWGLVLALSEEQREAVADMLAAFAPPRD